MKYRLLNAMTVYPMKKSSKSADFDGPGVELAAGTWVDDKYFRKKHPGGSSDSSAVPALGIRHLSGVVIKAPDRVSTFLTIDEAIACEYRTRVYRGAVAETMGFVVRLVRMPVEKMPRYVDYSGIIGDIARRRLKDA